MAINIRDMNMSDLQKHISYIQSCFETGQMSNSEELRKDCITALQLTKIVLDYHNMLANELMERKKKENG